MSENKKTNQIQPPEEIVLCGACNEDDLLYDDIGSGLKIKELRQKNEDLLRGLELYYKVIFDKLEE